MDAPSATGSVKIDSTAYLREKLGFLDDSEWKRFSNRRLELINMLKLDENKASKQEAEIHQVALTVATEFGYPHSAVPDFERLFRLGIQSVRRNRRRPTKTGSMPTTTFSVEVATPAPPTPTNISALQTLCELSSGEQVVANSLVTAGALRLAMGLALPVSKTALAQSMLQNLETGPLGEELARCLGTPNISQAISTACSRDAGATIQALLALLIDLSSVSDFPKMIQKLDCAEVKLQPIWWPGQAPPVHQAGAQPSPQGPQQQQTPTPTQPQQSPALGQVHGPAQVNQLAPMLGFNRTTNTNQLDPGPMWADRNVTISFGDKQLRFTFSPLKGSPPGVQEILDTCRSSFGLHANDVLRIRTRDSQKVIDTNADLADAFLSNKLDLEIFLPSDS